MQESEIAGNKFPHIWVPYVPLAGVGGGCFTVPYNMKITAATLNWAAAITGTATNFFTISFFNRGAAGAGTVQWGTAIAYSSGTNAAKATPVTITLSSTATDLLLAAGDVLSVEITTTGTGLICPGGAVTLAANYR